MVNNEHQGTRMSDDNPLGKAMQQVYADEVLRQAVKKFDAEVRAQGLLALEVALRWGLYHSALGDEDAIILGASKETQIVESVSLIQKGRLPAAILTLTDELWATVNESRANVL